MPLASKTTDTSDLQVFRIPGTEVNGDRERILLLGRMDWLKRSRNAGDHIDHQVFFFQ